MSETTDTQESFMRLSPAPVNRLDEESLQRGARNFVNYCLTCHTAKYMETCPTIIAVTATSAGG